jgi:hypothetical protein
VFTEEYTFLGWNIDPYAEGTTHQPNDSFIAEDDLNLYAIWCGHSDEHREHYSFTNEPCYYYQKCSMCGVSKQTSTSHKYDYVEESEDWFRVSDYYHRIITYRCKYHENATKWKDERHIEGDHYETIDSAQHKHYTKYCSICGWPGNTYITEGHTYSSSGDANGVRTTSCTKNCGYGCTEYKVVVVYKDPSTSATKEEDQWVVSGGTATLPSLTESATVGGFAGWSSSNTNITAPKNICAKYYQLKTHTIDATITVSTTTSSSGGGRVDITYRAVCSKPLPTTYYRFGILYIDYGNQMKPVSDASFYMKVNSTTCTYVATNQYSVPFSPGISYTGTVSYQTLEPVALTPS